MLETSPATGSGQSARQVHLALKSALQKLAEAEKSAVICFGQIMACKLYRELGNSSIHHYAQVEPGFSARRTRDFVALSRKLTDLPRLKAEIESGNLGYTAARVIAPVVDQSHEQGWVEFARYESLWEQIRKQGGYPVKGGVPADQVEALLVLMQLFAAVDSGPRGPQNTAAELA